MLDSTGARNLEMRNSCASHLRKDCTGGLHQGWPSPLDGAARALCSAFMNFGKTQADFRFDFGKKEWKKVIDSAECPSWMGQGPNARMIKQTGNFK